MSMTSAAEANLDARIRPEISALRARTSYPRRRSDSEPQPSAARESSGARPGPIRLTRRGRIVVWTLAALGVAALTAAIWLAVAGQAQASGNVRGGAPAASMRRVVVKPGQTLWGIASRVDPSVDPRVVIPEIVDLNSLNGTSIQVGQVLLVPTS